MYVEPVSLGYFIGQAEPGVCPISLRSLRTFRLLHGVRVQSGGVNNACRDKIYYEITIRSGETAREGGRGEATDILPVRLAAMAIVYHR